MKRFWMLLLCVPLLCSCSHTYLERQIYPICLSVDITDEGLFEIGLQAPQGVSGSVAAYDVLSATGETPEDALRVLAASTPYPFNFSQIRLCIIAWDLASTQPLRPLLRLLFELPSMRPNAYVMLAMGDALEVMRAQKPDFGMRLSTHLNLLFERLRQEQTLPDSTLSHCVRELSDGRSDLLMCICAVNPRLVPSQPAKEPASPSGGDAGGAAAAFSVGEPWSDELLPEGMVAGMMPRSSQNPVEYVGSAAISQGVASGILSAEETQLAVRILSEAKLRTAVSAESLQLQIFLPHGCTLVGKQEEIARLVAKLQTLRSDALTFGRIASKAFLTDAQWEGYRFRSRYPEAEVRILQK